ncbi:MAG: GNAT family N-acetyltransferase [Clostridia bacterium]|nr:GNAT family N-acetyltransferase [Clostridia bacterium]
MCQAFFSSPAVCHSIDQTSMETTFSSALKGSPYLRGMILLEETAVIGYVLLSFTYSNEVGGEVVWIEELYLKEAYRGQGYGTKVLQWIIAEYRNRAKRFRLEVTAENTGAKKLYEQLGFSPLPYEQMTIDQ